MMTHHTINAERGNKSASSFSSPSRLDPSLMYDLSPSNGSDQMYSSPAYEQSFTDLDTIVTIDEVLLDNTVSLPSSTEPSSLPSSTAINPASFPTTNSSPLFSLITNITGTTDFPPIIVPSAGGTVSYKDTYLTVRNVSSSEICLVHSVPSFHEYISALNTAGVLIFSIGILAVLLVLYMYVDTIKYVMKNVSSTMKIQSTVILSVYPVVAIASCCAIVLPKAHFPAEAITQGMFMIAMYQLFSLLIAYCGGEPELIKKLKLTTLNLKVAPCCCWPCCFVLPHLPVNKSSMLFLRIVVLQLPIVQIAAYIMLMVMWLEDERLYQINYTYVQPIIIMSIICGIWGIVVTVTVLEETLKEYLIKGKYFVLQFVLIFSKIQGLLSRVALWNNALPCNMPITPTVYANLIFNSLMLLEMVMLGFIARKLYKQPLESEINDSNIENSRKKQDVDITRF